MIVWQLSKFYSVKKLCYSGTEGNPRLRILKRENDQNVGYCIVLLPIEGEVVPPRFAVCADEKEIHPMDK
jgi:hypothetical protein